MGWVGIVYFYLNSYKTMFESTVSTCHYLAQQVLDNDVVFALDAI